MKKSDENYFVYQSSKSVQLGEYLHFWSWFFLSCGGWVNNFPYQNNIQKEILQKMISPAQLK
jgi:hypothetical protein